MTEAHAKLSVIRNCSKSSLPVCLGEGKQLAGGGWSAVAGGGGRRGMADSTQGERIWSSFQWQKVERGLLLLIHILWLHVSIKHIHAAYSFCMSMRHVQACTPIFVLITFSKAQNLKFKFSLASEVSTINRLPLGPFFVQHTHNVCSWDDVPQGRLGQVAWPTPASSCTSPIGVAESASWPLPAACSSPVSSIHCISAVWPTFLSSGWSYKVAQNPEHPVAMVCVCS
jgi:hypothetical protein